MSDDQIAQEKAKATQRVERSQLQQARNLIIRWRAVVAEHDIEPPRDLDRQTWRWLGEDVEQEKA